MPLRISARNAMKQPFQLRSAFDSVATCSLLLTLILLTAIGMLSYNSTQRFLNNDRRVIHTYQVINALNSILSDLRDAETGQRGYLLTGKPEYLPPYQNGKIAAPKDIQTLRRLLQGDTRQLNRLDALQAAVLQKLTELDHTVTLRRLSGSASALAVVNTGEGKASMDQARDIIDLMQADEQRLLAERTLSADSAGVSARIWGVLASLIAAVLIAVAIGFVGRYLRQREAAEAENLSLAEAARDAAVQQRVFLKDVLASVTEGRLALCDTEADLPSPLTKVGEVIPLNRKEGPGPLRYAAVSAARGCSFSEERVQDLATSASEAGMNAITHGGGGQAIVRTDGADFVQVWVTDQGTGISLDTLPQSTLDRGYSSAGSFGHGFWLMLQMCDRVSLLTGPQGTTVVLEQSKTEREASWTLHGVRAAALSFRIAESAESESGSTPDMGNRAFYVRTYN